MRLTEHVHICWFGDSRWDKTLYKCEVFYRLGHIGIIRKL